MEYKYMAKKYITLRVTQEMHDSLKQEAKKRGVTMTHVIEEKVAAGVGKKCTLEMEIDGIRVPITPNNVKIIRE